MGLPTALPSSPFNFTARLELSMARRGGGRDGSSPAPRNLHGWRTAAGARRLRRAPRRRPTRRLPAPCAAGQSTHRHRSLAAGTARAHTCSGQGGARAQRAARQTGGPAPITVPRRGTESWVRNGHPISGRAPATSVGRLTGENTRSCGPAGTTGAMEAFGNTAVARARGRGAPTRVGTRAGRRAAGDVRDGTRAALALASRRARAGRRPRGG